VFAGGSQTLLKGGTASATVISSGAEVLVSSGAFDRHALVGASGQEIVLAGGQAIGATISGGGTELVSSGGGANGATISSGGTQTVLLGGSASGATVSEGGNEIVWGVAQNTLVNSGGMLTVSSGGQANAMVVQSGGSALVMSGAAFSGATIVGGRLEISSGGVALSSTVTFVGNSGTLQLDSNKFRGKIEGFTADDAIDLLGITYNSGTTTLGYLDNGTGSGGTLTVSDGVHTARLSMIGAYVVENFTLSTDGHGGTMITDRRLAAARGSQRRTDRLRAEASHRKKCGERSMRCGEQKGWLVVPLPCGPRHDRHSCSRSFSRSILPIWLRGMAAVVTT